VRIVTVEARDGSRWRAPANLADRSVRMLYTAARETVPAGPAVEHDCRLFGPSDVTARAN